MWLLYSQEHGQFCYSQEHGYFRYSQEHDSFDSSYFQKHGYWYRYFSYSQEHGQPTQPILRNKVKIAQFSHIMYYHHCKHIKTLFAFSFIMCFLSPRKFFLMYFVTRPLRAKDKYKFEINCILCRFYVGKQYPRGKRLYFICLDF